uniref:Rubisco LSMT substrate-binding domain-containing protein n=1 Tax=Leersia perrieri TaxID=77586 RepID=A0A0D9WKE2_9ORYZ
MATVAGAASPLLLLLPSPLPRHPLAFPPRRAAASRRVLLQPPRAGRPRLRDRPPTPVVEEDELGADEEDDVTPPLRLLEPPQEDDPFPPEMEPADPDFYRIGYARMMRAYGIEFLEGPDGMAVYASRDVEPLRRARVIMEIPLELMLTITQKPPWMFFPDIIPLGHPIFDVIESTDPETDWDLRLACLLLYAFDIEDNFWQLYGDFLPSVDECTSLLLAPKEDLMELEDQDLATKMLKNQQRTIDFWQKHWHKTIPLKLKRLAPDHVRFLWALSIVQSRSVNLKLRMGAFIQDANVLAPYADDDRLHEWSEQLVYGKIWFLITNAALTLGENTFVDGGVVAAARTLPTWSDGDVPAIPSVERKSAQALQEECQTMLESFSTTIQQDQDILDSDGHIRRTREIAIKYRLHRKLLLQKIIDALDIYQDRILF